MYFLTYVSYTLHIGLGKKFFRILSVDGFRIA